MLLQKTTPEKLCLLCSKKISGRTDKKFCDDYCRSAFNNELKSTANNLVRKINNALSKNRKILENIMGENDSAKRISRSKLLQLGFQFKYITDIFTNHKKHVYYFCYEFGYLPLDSDWYLIVKRNEE